MVSTITRRSFSLGLALAATTLAACGSKESSTDSGSTDVVKGETKDGDTVTIKVGASPVPHGDILSFVQNNLTKGSGISLDVVEFTDYVLPNTSLEDGSLAANYFQTPDYLAQQVADKGYKFVSIADVHVEPLGLYSNKYTSVDQIPEGGTIALNNDPANLARGLKLLQQAKLIEVDPSVKLPTENDVTSNPKKLVFKPVEGAQVARALDDVDAGVVNGNYAIEAKKVPSKDALVLESGQNSPYANELVVRTDDKDNPALVKLAELLTSEQTKKFIQDTWTDGSVIPAF